MENVMVWTYAAYVTISLALTVFVARTLHKNGRIFLVDSFHGNEPIADSVNHLLVVGFYLINIGFVSLALKYGQPAATVQEGIEYLSWKVGIVALVLGGMHFFNVLIFASMRSSARNQTERLGRHNGAPEVRPVDYARR